MAKIHYLYKIVNLIDGKEYVGIHSTNNMNDGYFGSGTYLRKAIAKHGRDNFKKEIISTFDSREEALLKEEELVNPQYIRRSDVYNLIIGGMGCRRRGATIKKYPLGGVEVPVEMYNIDIDHEKRCEFFADEKEFIQLARGAYMNWIYTEMMEKQGEKGIFGSHIHYRIAEMVRKHLDGYCETITKCFNDKRHHTTAMNLLNKMHQIGMLGTAIKVRPLTIELWRQ